MVSARLDHFAERFNQQDQCFSDNCVKIQSLVSSIDRFKLVSESQFLLLKDQIKVLSESSDIDRRPSLPLQAVGVSDVEQVEVIEGHQGKMKGLEQTILTEQKGLHDMVVDSSLGTALTRCLNTSGPVSGERINLIRERDVVRKGIEWSEN